MDDTTRVQRSKALSMWLRHKPERGGLTLSKGRGPPLPALRGASAGRGYPTSPDEWTTIIPLAPRGPFETGGARVRARCALSVEWGENPPPEMPPATLF